MPLRSASLPALPLATGAIAALALAAPLGAQAPVYGTDINAAADSGRQRSPLLFGSAYTLPQGARGISFQQAASLEHDRYETLLGRTNAYRHQFASTLSMYWGVRSWLTMGGSLGFTSTTAELTSSDGTYAPMPGEYFSRSTVSVGNLRGFARARLYRSGDGDTQVAANASFGTSPSSSSATDRSMSATLGLAFAQRVGALSLHLAPTIEAGTGGTFMQLGGGVTFPIMPHVSGSFEGIASGTRPGSRATPPAAPMLELGGGLRFDFGRLKIDLAHRQVTTPNTMKTDQQRMRFVLGTHVAF